MKTGVLSLDGDAWTKLLADCERPAAAWTRLLADGELPGAVWARDHATQVTAFTAGLLCGLAGGHLLAWLTGACG